MDGRSHAERIRCAYEAEKTGKRRWAALHQSEFQKQRLQVIKRDRYRCLKCGRLGNVCVRLRAGHPDILQVHHVHGWRVTDMEFLRTLCAACHVYAPNGESYWAWEKSRLIGRRKILKLRRRLISSPPPKQKCSKPNRLFQELQGSPGFVMVVDRPGEGRVVVYDLVGVFQRALEGLQDA